MDKFFEGFFEWLDAVSDEELAQELGAIEQSIQNEKPNSWNILSDVSLDQALKTLSNSNECIAFDFDKQKLEIDYCQNSSSLGENFDNNSLFNLAA